MILNIFDTSGHFWLLFLKVKEDLQVPRHPDEKINMLTVFILRDTLDK